MIFCIDSVEWSFASLSTRRLACGLWSARCWQRWHRIFCWGRGFAASSAAPTSFRSREETFAKLDRGVGLDSMGMPGCKYSVMSTFACCMEATWPVSKFPFLSVKYDWMPYCAATQDRIARALPAFEQVILILVVASAISKKYVKHLPSHDPTDWKLTFLTIQTSQPSSSWDLNTYRACATFCFYIILYVNI